MNLWRINIIPASKKGFDPRQYCIDRKIAGIGWPLDDVSEPLTLEKYTTEGRAKYPQDKGWLPAWNAISHNIKIGDLIWTRTKDGNHYLGKITSEWRYDFSSDAINHDIANVRDCEWMKVGLIDNVPGTVVRSFMPSSTLQRVGSFDALTYSQRLYNDLSGVSYYQPQISKDKDIFSLLSPEDCEDVVGLFLQIKHGYLLIASTCKRDTVGYEYELIHRLTGEKAVVQVKSGNISLNRNDFEQIDANVFLFTTNQEYHGEERNNIICLHSKELKEFMSEYPNLLPEKVRFWTSKFNK